MFSPSPPRDDVGAIGAPHALTASNAKAGRAFAAGEGREPWSRDHDSGGGRRGAGGDASLGGPASRHGGQMGGVGLVPEQWLQRHPEAEWLQGHPEAGSSYARPAQVGRPPGQETLRQVR